MTTERECVEVTTRHGTAIRVTHLEDWVVSSGREWTSRRVRVRLQNAAGLVVWADIDGPTETHLGLLAGATATPDLTAAHLCPLLDSLHESATPNAGPVLATACHAATR